MYRRRSAVKRKDKGIAILIEPEPEKKTKKQLKLERLGHEEAVRLQEQLDEEERAKRAKIARDAEIARQLQEEINKAEQEKVVAQDDQPQVIDWNDPSVIRYYALKNKPVLVAQARKNMITYLKNQGNYKISDFKNMSYEDIRPIFEKVWDFNHTFVPKDSDIEKEVMQSSGFNLQQESKKAEENKNDQEEEDIIKYIEIVPVEEIAIDAIPLASKPLVIVDVEIISEGKVSSYHIIRADGSSKRYTTLTLLL
ncbi:hypothetical protein Tco_0189482 [Tanacetum coccineum]